MKSAYSLILALICFALGVLPAEADREEKILPRDFDTAATLDQALTLAKAKNKAVILYYTRDRCPPCNMLQSRLRRESVAAPYRDGYVFTAVWGNRMDRDERAYYRDRYDAFLAPSWVVFTSGGEYVCTSLGGFTSDKGGKRLHEAIQLRLGMSLHAEDPDARDCMTPGKVN
ncbi:MAG: thioredoxin family protein [Gammaproteobacteria bacterium]|nr:thioredoxin family protein [Gammaproteobacteria bacterium]